MFQKTSKPASRAPKKGVSHSFEGISQSEMYEEISRIQAEVFPEFFGPSGKFPGFFRADVLYSASKPSHLFSPGLPLLTPNILMRLQSGSGLLSVGAGPAYWEQLLVKGLGIAKDSVYITDRTEDFMPVDLVRHKFDMYEKWPELGRQFEYIIFRDSTFVGQRFLSADKEARPAQLAHLLFESFGCLSFDGQIRMNLFIEDESVHKAAIILAGRGIEFDLELKPSGGTDSLLVVKSKI